MKKKWLIYFIFFITISACKQGASAADAKKAAELNQKGIGFLQSNPEAALILFKEARALDPGISDYANNIGVVYLDQKKPDKALPYFLKSTEIDSKYGRGYYNEGVACQGLGENQKAIVAYSKALKFIPSPEIYYNLGIVYSRVKNNKEAIASYRKFIGSAPASYGRAITDAKEKIKELGNK